MLRTGSILVVALFVAACQSGGSAPGPLELSDGDFSPFLPVRRGEPAENITRIPCQRWWRSEGTYVCRAYLHPWVGGGWGPEGVLEVRTRAGQVIEAEWRCRITVEAAGISGLGDEAERIARELTARLGSPVFSNVDRGDGAWRAAVARGELHLRWWVAGSRFVFRVALLDADGRPRERELAFSLAGIER